MTGPGRLGAVGDMLDRIEALGMKAAADEIRCKLVARMPGVVNEFDLARMRRALIEQYGSVQGLTWFHRAMRQADEQERDMFLVDDGEHFFAELARKVPPALVARLGILARELKASGHPRFASAPRAMIISRSGFRALLEAELPRLKLPTSWIEPCIAVLERTGEPIRQS